MQTALLFIPIGIVIVLVIIIFIIVLSNRSKKEKPEATNDVELVNNQETSVVDATPVTESVRVIDVPTERIVAPLNKVSTSNDAESVLNDSSSNEDVGDNVEVASIESKTDNIE